MIKVKPGKTYTYSKIGSNYEDCLSMNTQECKVFKLVNNLRRNKGLNPLIAVENCIDAAKYHSQQMYKYKRLKHDGKHEGWYKRITRFGALGKQMSENIALASTADQTVNLWLNSQEHKTNMLKPLLTHSGVGTYQRYWTQCFIEI